MPHNPSLISSASLLNSSAPLTAHAIRMLNLEIATIFKSNLSASDFNRLLRREAALLKAAASEAHAIKKVIQSAD